MRTFASVCVVAFVAGLGAVAVRGVAQSSSAAAGPAASARYVVLFKEERVPPDLADRVNRLGAKVERSLDAIGASAVSGLDPGTAAQLARDPDVRSVEPDTIDSVESAAELGESDDVAAAQVPASPESALLYARQWNLRAIGADVAWRAGRLGTRDVRVAVVDTGSDYLHPELAGLVDLDHSHSFVSDPEEATALEAFPGRLPFTDLYWHGTAVHSTIASNAVRLAGVLREVTLVTVKVGNRFGKFSRFDWVTGIKYAADPLPDGAAADVINTSAGGYFDRIVDHESIELYRRAYEYAFRKGALIVGVAGNAGEDNQHDQGKVRACELGNAMCVGWTGPTSGATVDGPWTDVDAVAPRSGFGSSMLDVVAPGGQLFTFCGMWRPCLTTWSGDKTALTPKACQAAACRNGGCVTSTAGSSFAAPHVVALAALLVEQMGKGKPAQIRARILQTADDLGAPGQDPYYGSGRVNVPRALGLVP